MAPASRKSLFEYILDIILWGLFITNLYRILRFRVLPGWTLTDSKRIFWILWFLVSLVCILVTPRRGRTGLTVFASIHIAPAIYFLISYRDLYPRFVGVTLSVAIGSAAVYSLLVLAGFLLTRKTTKLKSFKGFLLHFSHRLRLITGVVLSVFFCSYMVLSYFGGALLKADIPAADPSVTHQTVEDNMDTVLLLQDGIWDGLSARERLDVFQTIANIEASHLGLPHELTVTAELLEDHTLGMYDDQLHCIIINANHLMKTPAKEMVHAIAHEAYHAYEHRLVDLFNRTDAQGQNLIIFNRIRSYQEEFADYIHPDEDFFAYDAQAVETDSDLYGNEAVAKYFNAILFYVAPES